MISREREVERVRSRASVLKLLKVTAGLISDEADMNEGMMRDDAVALQAMTVFLKSRTMRQLCLYSWAIY